MQEWFSPRLRVNPQTPHNNIPVDASMSLLHKKDGSRRCRNGGAQGPPTCKLNVKFSQWNREQNALKSSLQIRGRFLVSSVKTLSESKFLRVGGGEEWCGNENGVWVESNANFTIKMKTTFFWNFPLIRKKSATTRGSWESNKTEFRSHFKIIRLEWSEHRKLETRLWRQFSVTRKERNNDRAHQKLDR